jgi:hypothetical protein
MRRLPRLLLLPTLLLLFPVFGCDVLGEDPGGKSCTLIGCQSGLQVQLQHGTWPAGSYSLNVILDDATPVVCIVTLPFASVSTGATCSAATVQVQTSGQALGADQHAVTGLWVQTTPAKVQLVLRRDGAVMLDQTLQPTYTTSRPNGPDCEPLCTQANAVVVVP